MKPLDYPSAARACRVLMLGRGGLLDGSQRQLAYLVGGLDRRRFEPIVVLDKPGPAQEYISGLGVGVYVRAFRPWRTFPDSLLRYSGAFALARFARQHAVGLVHASDIWRSGYARFVAHRLGVPSVLHVRGPMSAEEFAKHGVARASAVIAIGQRYQNDLLLAGVSPERLEVIEDAVDLGQFRPAPAGDGAQDALRKRFGVQGRLLVGLVGRVEPFKRVLEFLHVIAPFVARGPAARASYLIVGEPGRESYYQAVQQAVRQLALERHVVFTGRCDDMPAILRGLDILVTMSGGSVMFEAMACAKTVLSVRAHDRPSIHARHDKTAWCVTTDRPEPATAALERLVDDATLRQRLGQAAQTWAQEHLSVAAMVDKTQALYARLTGSQAGSRLRP